LTIAVLQHSGKGKKREKLYLDRGEAAGVTLAFRTGGEPSRAPSLRLSRPGPCCEGRPPGRSAPDSGVAGAPGPSCGSSSSFPEAAQPGGVGSPWRRRRAAGGSGGWRGAETAVGGGRGAVACVRGSILEQGGAEPGETLWPAVAGR
jgi:hypothetical protein